jgi:hypothetical protein
MIARRVDGAWWLIRQLDHASHAGVVSDAWKAGPFGGEQITDSLRDATARHDLGWAEADRAPRIDPSSGGPANFTLIDEARHTAFYAEAVRKIAETDPASAYLVSLHASGLYSRRYGWAGLSPVDWTKIGEHGRRLLEEERAYRAQLVAQLDPSEAEFEALWRGYMLLETFDLLSLLVCLGVETDSCAPVPSVPGQWLNLQIKRLGPWEVSLEPWPFPDPELVVPIPARRLPNERFSDDEELQAALAEAEELTQPTRYLRTS